MPTTSPPRFRFGEFKLHPQTGELVRAGQKIPLHDQLVQLLLALLERPGELVTREELKARMWPAGTYVDFERGLNKAVNKLRDALGDSAEQPRFIETLPRKGYRFIGSVTKIDEPTTEQAIPGAARHTWRWQPAALFATVFAVAAVIFWTNPRSWRDALLRHEPSRAQIASLAVLPLENLSGDPEQAYFADGMTDALITEIARAGSLRVISRTTALRYRGTRKTIQQIGRELNVDAVVEGTVLRSGEQVRITAQLIQASTDNHLWAQSYERDAKEVLRLQQDVATEIARRIGSMVKPVEPARTVNPTAYGEYLQGRFWFLQYRPDGWQKAIEHYRQAIRADPNFAPAYAGLAESYLVARGWFAVAPEEGFRQGKAAAERALQLDPTVASAHLAMGVISDQEWNYANAEREFNRGLELNPNDPVAWQQHGDHLLSQGRFAEAIRDQERAIGLDPFSPIIHANLARAFYYSRQYDNAIAQAKTTFALEPDNPVALRWLERSYRHKGMFEEALTARLRMVRADERTTWERAYRAAGYRGVLLLDAEANLRSGAVIEAARSFAQAREPEKALAALEECYRRRWPGLERLNVDPDFDPVRSDPRYQALLRKVGYQE